MAAARDMSPPLRHDHIDQIGLGSAAVAVAVVAACVGSALLGCWWGSVVHDCLSGGFGFLAEGIGGILPLQPQSGAPTIFG